MIVQEYVLRMAPPEERQQRRYLGSFPLVRSARSDTQHAWGSMRYICTAISTGRGTWPCSDDRALQ